MTDAPLDSESFADTQWRGQTDRRLSEAEQAVAGHTARLNAHDTILGTHVSKDAFAPIKAFVYGTMATLGLAVAGALLKLVILPTAMR